MIASFMGNVWTNKKAPINICRKHVVDTSLRKSRLDSVSSTTDLLIQLTQLTR